ncbi:MAG: helix-turn-helix transcriptional regulator [Cyclobacteriaceae bacterium]
MIIEENVRRQGDKMKNTLYGLHTPRFSKDETELFTVENEGSEAASGDSVLKAGIIHFYFCISGQANFAFGPHYSRDIREDFNYFFYNPDMDLPFRLTLIPGTRMVYLSVSIGVLHQLFVDEPHGLPILSADNAGRKFYDERSIPPVLKVVLNSVFSVPVSDSAAKIYYQAKALEILSLYFSNRVPDMENCPFLNDEDTVRKIKNAKELLIKRADNPPGLKELAKLSGLNEFQLKVGFKEVYGNTVYGYLLDHKMDHARVLLDSGQYQVNEVAYKIGYSNPSHFIAAFRKKFGITPKKYLMNR